MRRASLTIYYAGKDISLDISKYLLSFSFTEKADGEADEITITLDDRDMLWQNAWAPQDGDIIRAVITCENWWREGDAYKLECGEFQVDDNSLSSTSGGDIVTIRAVPALVASSLKDQFKTRAWENASLERIARDIADGASLTLAYLAEHIPLARTDQRQESDLAFLQRLCSAQGCRLKLSGGELVVFEGLRADALPSVLIRRTETDTFQGGRATAKIYKKVVVTYFDPKKGKNTRHTYTPPNAPQTGKTLTINTRVENAAHARRVAKAELRKRNAKRKTAEWSGMGNVDIRAGATVRLSGWGVYDGTYIVKQAEHSYGGAYTTRANLELALEY